MTRLRSDEIDRIPSTMEVSDRAFEMKIGADISEVAAHAAGFSGSRATAFDRSEAKVVPMTSGKGVISGFAQAIAAILNHLGLKTEVASKNDVGGISEAFTDGAKMVFAADDEFFVGLNLRNLKVSYNYDATGRGYAAALEKKIDGLDGKSVALIGAGRVGSAAAEYMCGRGANVFAYDPLGWKVDELRMRLPLCLKCESVAECISSGDHVMLAAPGRNFITARMIKEGAIFTAPAVPLGFTKAALKKLGQDRIIHDKLALGVATMAFDLVR